MLSRLALIGEQLGEVGGSILLEPLTDDGNGYPLTSLAACHTTKQRFAADFGVANCGLLLDTFHLANNGYDPAQGLKTYAR